MDYAMLARNSIQSTSDQEDYRNYATISANAAIGVTPEQAAIWSYPLRDGTKRKLFSIWLMRCCFVFTKAAISQKFRRSGLNL